MNEQVLRSASDNADVTTTIPRPEHPNPQMRRDRWTNLNGKWDFDFDYAASGIDKGWASNPPLTRRITVPFCPESRLSGLAHTDFIPCCWYRRTVTVSSEDMAGRRVILHFGAVDYEAHVFVNGHTVGEHRGGYASFAFDVTDTLHEGDNELVVCVNDDVRSHRQPGGKQSDRYESYGCSYTRTTGIWQTVWLEFVPQQHISSLRITPNLADGSVLIETQIVGDGELDVAISYQDEPCGSAHVQSDGNHAAALVKLDAVHPWQVGVGGLYDVTLTFGEDVVHSYFGLRSVAIDGEDFLINGKRVFQRLVLDQGFYPDGIYTAPNAEALERDVLLSQAAGFNGARLHEKAFEPLFLYYCDLHGYLAWGEMANWNLDITTAVGIESFLPEWEEIVQRDVNHPSIVGWCPFNETWDLNGHKQDDAVLSIVYRTTKAIDPTRPCIDTSGMFHVITDIYDVHDYEQDVATFAGHYAGLVNNTNNTTPSDDEPKYTEPFPERQQYHGGQPFFVSEYGGIKWIPESQRDDTQSWGYGEAAHSETEYIERYRGLTCALLDNPRMFGFCYTQLYDVEQECNGLYSYDRVPKINIDAIRDINQREAAYERR